MDLFFFFFWGGGEGGAGGHYEIGLFFFFLWGGGGVSFLYILGFFKVKIQKGNIFWAAKFQIFLGMPDIPDFFLIFFQVGGGGGVGLGVNSRCWVQACV